MFYFFMICNAIFDYLQTPSEYNGKNQWYNILDPFRIVIED